MTTEPQFKSIHNLDFLSRRWSHPLNYDEWQEYKVGACHGQWVSTVDTYDILTVINEQPGNGHFEDVLQWFEQSCRRDNRSLRILEVWNKRLARHLVEKRGFTFQSGDNLIKHFK